MLSLSRWCPMNPNWNLYGDFIKQIFYYNPINLDLVMNQIHINLIMGHFCNIILVVVTMFIGKTNSTIIKNKTVHL